MEVREGYKNTEVGVIPEDWEVKKLSDLTSLMTNGFVGIATTHYTEFENGITYIQGYNVEENSFNVNGIKKVTKEFHKQHPKSCLQEGDLLTIQTGEVGLTTIVTKGLEGSNCHALIITRFEKHNSFPKFYSYYLNSASGKKQLKEIETGSTMKHINVGDMIHLKVPVPTKAEQTAIATALSDADALINSLERLIAKKRNIKQGAMQELLKPKEGWVVKKLGDLTKVFTKQTGFDYTAYIKPSLVQYRTEDTIPFIQNKDFNNRWINFDTDYFIPKSVATQFPRILLNEKSLLISISGSVGNVGLYDSQELAFIGGAVAILKFKDSDLIDWVMVYLKSIEGQKKLLDNVKAGSHQNLILDDIRKIEIVFPPNQEQTRIATILSDMDSEIQALETKLEKYRKIKLGMMQNLLTGKIRLV
ncbi:MAG: restriction endonuclease subunit S [Bacteroidales bacterium]|nr:restriction endonuclease subunit S [Bacteroidales bacterium]